MENVELLNAISEMMDKKLDAKLSVLEKRMNTRFDKIEDRLEKVEIRLCKVEDRLEKVEIRLCKVEVRLGKVESRVRKLESDMRILKLDMDTKVSSAVKEITSCYFDTYKRYQKNNDKMEDTFLKADVMQSVIGKHLEQIQKNRR